MGQIDDLTNAEVNTEVRPYFGGVNEQDTGLATLILLAEPSPNTAENDSTFDYLSSFTNYIDTPSAPGNQMDIMGNNTIPELSLMETPEISTTNTVSITKYYGIFNNFSLINVAESKEQMTKVHMNFGGSWNAFFFGDKPTVYSFNGFFLDSQQYPYYQEFMFAYDNYLAGRKCIENKFQMLISYDGKIVGGYILGINTSINATNPYMKAFNFTVLINSEGWYRTNIVRDVHGKIVSGMNYMSSSRTKYSALNYNAINNQ
jgi:hypothetical protein